MNVSTCRDEDIIRAAEQQPEWNDGHLVRKVRAVMAAMPALVEWEDIWQLRRLLAEVAQGRMQIIQAGDCAEDPADCVPEVLQCKVALLHTLAGLMQQTVGLPVLRIGRIAGQFAKPRSRPTEIVDGIELPVFRGLAVNSPEPTSGARTPDPLRLLSGYHAAHAAMQFLRQHGDLAGRPVTQRVWTSHEALLLDYELPLLRRGEGGRQLLASTHWPWIGERTRDVHSAHVRLVSGLANPVACKIGPRATAEQLLGLCRRLDPDRQPGRLTFIARLGAGTADRLAELAAEVQAGGYPVIWLCDPMHGNTITAPCGRKTRLLGSVIQEVAQFPAAVTSAGGVAGGLHLEVTPDDVTECVTDEHALRYADLNAAYTSLCDPRLNPEQARAVASAWWR